MIFKTYEEWANGTKHWTEIMAIMSLEEFVKNRKGICEAMGMKLISVVVPKQRIDL